MNGVMGHITSENSTFEWNMPGFDWVVHGSDELGFWLIFGTSLLYIFGLLFSALKGKWGFVLLALAVPVVGAVLAVVGGVRLAKPRSVWARLMYDRKAMAVAIERHEPPINLEAYPERKLRKGFERPLNRPSTDHLG